MGRGARPEAAEEPAPGWAVSGSSSSESGLVFLISTHLHQVIGPCSVESAGMFCC